MRIQFTDKDIEGAQGLFIIKNTSPIGSANMSFAGTVSYKIGYSFDNKEKPCGLISFLTDGWYCPIGTSKELADHLNNDKDGYRIMTKSEISNILNHSEQGFRVYAK